MKSSDRPAETGIGELAARFGLPAHVLRHWESVGLLSPRRDAGGRRRYGPGDAHRVAAVLRAKEAGLGLAEIRRLLTGDGGAAARRAALEHQAAELRRRIAGARASLRLVEHALACPHEDLSACPHARRAMAAGARG
ncbi:MerR family transcriptional regulator [Streptomyces capparidis]